MRRGIKSGANYRHSKRFLQSWDVRQWRKTSNALANKGVDFLGHWTLEGWRQRRGSIGDGEYHRRGQVGAGECGLERCEAAHRPGKYHQAWRQQLLFQRHQQAAEA